MKKVNIAKRAVAALIALVMCAAVALLPGAADTGGYIDVGIASCERLSGEAADVYIVITANTGIAGLCLKLKADPALGVPSVVNLIPDMTFTYKIADDGIILLWDGTVNTGYTGNALRISFPCGSAKPGEYKLELTCPDSQGVYRLDGFGFTDIDARTASGTLGIVKKIGMEYVGCQETEVKDGKFAVRFCAVTDGNVTDAGFDIIYNNDGDGATRGICGYPETFSEMTARGEVLYNAEDFGGESFCLLTVNDIPATGEAVFSVIPTGRESDGAGRGSAFVVTYRDGVYAGTSKAN